MEWLLCSVKDTAVQVFNRPMTVRARGEVVRSVGQEVNRAADDNQLYTHSEDFELYQLAVFDDQTGQVTPAFELILRCKDMKRSA